MKIHKTASVRADLLDNKLQVPIGNSFYGDKAPLPYRWKGEIFQIKYKNIWQEAYSIDWDLLN